MRGASLAMSVVVGAGWAHRSCSASIDPVERMPVLATQRQMDSSRDTDDVSTKGGTTMHDAGGRAWRQRGATCPACVLVGTEVSGLIGSQTRGTAAPEL